MKNQYAIVVSEFNHEVTDKLLEGAYARLVERGIDKTNITVKKVPGAVEIPLTAQLFAKSKQYKAIICLGAIIRGETDHYDYVCDQVSLGCQKVMLEHNIPVIFGVLTTNDEEQALARADKGTYCADAAIHMSELVAELSV
jgi:6,7-dimethyl-8-ribityllumazine synthase